MELLARPRMACATGLRIIGLAALAALMSPAHAQTAAAVEYYYTAWDYYFVTANPDEIALLDGGGFDGNWVRTGESFIVWTQGAAGAADTCRFFSTSFAPKSSHFYTPFGAECAAVKSSRDWQYEGIAFSLQLADANGACPSGTDALFRLYNNGKGGAPNHRYTTRRATVDEMHIRGWSSEGNGPDATFACVPGMGSDASPARGIWSGTTTANEAAVAVVVEDGTFFLLLSKPGSGAEASVIQGSSTAAGGTLSSSDANNYPLADGSATTGIVSRVSVTGSYGSGNDLRIAIVGAGGTRTLSATLVAGSTQGATFPGVVGTYDGAAGNVAIRVAAHFTIDGDGKLSGSNATCSVQAFLQPRPAIDAYRFFPLAYRGQCPFVGEYGGILYYDPAAKQVRGFAHDSERTNMYFLIATRQ